MAKGSGGTRASSLSSSGTYQFGYSESDANRISKLIAKGGWVELPASFSEIDKDERDLLLMMSGFTGLTEPDSNSLYFPIEKKEFIKLIAEDLGNIVSGYRMDDTTSWTIGYKDGSRKYLSEMENDLSDIKLTSSQSFKTQQSVVARALKNAAYIIRSDGYNEGTYWVSKDGLSALKEYGSFEKWTNGRGERKRDYIQDDWI